MAGKVRYLVKRGDSYWARIVVPAKLRTIIGKNELREPLGSNHKTAEKNLHSVVARFHEILEKAKDGHRTALKPLSLFELAHAHHAEEIALEEQIRNARDDRGQSLFNNDPELFRDGYLKALLKVTAGRASDEEATAIIGWAIQKFQNRDNVSATYGPKSGANWRQLLPASKSTRLSARAKRSRWARPTSQPILC